MVTSDCSCIVYISWGEVIKCHSTGYYSLFSLFVCLATTIKPCGAGGGYCPELLIAIPALAPLRNHLRQVRQRGSRRLGWKRIEALKGWRLVCRYPQLP